MKIVKPPQFQAAFTLLELIIVIVILAILSAYILSRPSSSDTYQQDTVIEQIISAGRIAQQMGMSDSTRTFSLSIQTSSINLLQDSGSGNTSISPGSVSFPLSFGSKITLSPTGNIIYDRLGETTLTTVGVEIDNITKNICFETSGYIHRC